MAETGSQSCCQSEGQEVDETSLQHLDKTRSRTVGVRDEGGAGRIFWPETAVSWSRPQIVTAYVFTKKQQLLKD